MGSVEVCRLLLDTGAFHVNETSIDPHIPPLAYAVMGAISGRVPLDAVRLLVLQRGANPAAVFASSSGTRNETAHALMYAVKVHAPGYWMLILSV